MTKFTVLTRDFGKVFVTAESYRIDDEKVLHFPGDAGAFREWIGVVPLGETDGRPDA